VILKIWQFFLRKIISKKINLIIEIFAIALLPRHTRKGAKQLILFLFYFIFVAKIRRKVPHENIYGKASVLENFQKKN
jgi:hypothetical protein